MRMLLGGSLLLLALLSGVGLGCEICTHGKDQCECRKDNSCDAGLTCHISTCCEVGSHYCVCGPNDECDDGLSCNEGECQSKNGPSTGFEGGPSGTGG
jgi:hypothetical protein